MAEESEPLEGALEVLVRARPQKAFFLFLLQAKALHHLGNDFLSVWAVVLSS